MWGSGDGWPLGLTLEAVLHGESHASISSSPSAFGDDRLAAVYQLQIHLVGISPQICRRVWVRGDTSLAELHHIF